MIGVIIGDIIGSRFEWHNHKSKDFELFSDLCRPTDDSLMSLAIAKTILESGKEMERLGSDAVRCMREVGNRYLNHGFGGRFKSWLQTDNPQPYGSYGNGAGMRVSPCAYAADSLTEALEMAEIVTDVTHNHPESQKGAKALTTAIWMARQGSVMPEIREVITRDYYPLDFTLDGIRDTYKFQVSSQNSVPQALEAFFESTSFEDAIRGAISIGGDSDTIAAMSASIAEAYYGVPAALRTEAESRLDAYLLDILNEFEAVYPAVADKQP